MAITPTTERVEAAACRIEEHVHKFNDAVDEFRIAALNGNYPEPLEVLRKYLAGALHALHELNGTEMPADAIRGACLLPLIVELRRERQD